jgi:hypothetical protein
LDIDERSGIDLGDRPSIGAQTLTVFEEVLARTVGVKRFETEFADQAQYSLLTRAHPLSADFNDLAVTDGVIEGSSPDAVSSLDDQDVDTMGSKRSSGREAGEPRAYDHDSG